MKRPLPIALAATLHDPPGALRRDLQRAIPLLQARFAHVAVSVSPATSPQITALLRDAGMDAGTPPGNFRGPLYRLCVRRALVRGIERVHYLDLDRALHWLWAAPAEWDRVLRRSLRVSGLLIGRTRKAHQSHQRPLFATETIVNRLFCERLGWPGPVDFFVPSFALNVDDTRALLRRSRARDENFYGEWAAILGSLPGVDTYVECAGLEWETPDRDRRGVRRLGLPRWRARFETPAEWGLRVGMAAAFMRGFEHALARATPAPPPRRVR